MIKVYTSPTCQPCRLTKQYLDRGNIAYETIDIAENPAAVSEIAAMGYRQVPVVVVTPEEHWNGFRPDLMRNLLP